MTIDLSSVFKSRLLYQYLLTEPGPTAAIREFEGLLDDPATPELAWQDLFTRFPWLITRLDYRRAHPHLVFRADDGRKMIPDFVLEPYDQDGLSDILDLKLPTARPIIRADYTRLSGLFSTACAQMLAYERNRARFQEEHGLLLYRPELILVMGRSVDIGPFERKKLITQVELRTYDDLLSRAKRLRQHP